MAWRLAPHGRFLDVRSVAQVVANPISEAASIPFEELPHRLHELPPKEEPILVLDLGPEAEPAVRFFERGGRRAILTPSPQPSRPEPKEGEIWRLWRPNPFLEEILPRLPVGTALDLACGSGREAVAMAADGFGVTAVDHLSDALELGRNLAARYLIWGPTSPLSPGGRGSASEASSGEGAPPIRWLQADLETLPPQPLPHFHFAKTREGLALITAFRYLHRPLFAQIPDLLAPGGSFVFETFTALHRERHGKPRQDAHILRLGEAPSLVPGLEVVHFDEGWRGESHTARLWARRPW